MGEKMKAIALLSGGLDSMLAIKVMQAQGVEIEAVHFASALCTSAVDEETLLKPPKAWETLGVPVRVIDSSADFIEMVRAPRHGFGSNMNPCIDCKIQMLKRAADYMRHSGASFLITGEVLGQRPMSQRREAMRLIEKEAGLDGLILRPLSAKLLEPTIPEKEGWVDRERLQGISGRSRRKQMDLAIQHRLRSYPSPAGGCLLTDPEFACRLRELIEHGELSIDGVNLLKVGRHFRLDPSTKAVVGRQEQDNEKILRLSRVADLLIEAADIPGPSTLLRGSLSAENINTAAALTALYAKARGQIKLLTRRGGEGEASVGIESVVETGPADAAVAKQLIIVRGNDEC